MNGAAALYGKSLYDLAKEERNTKEILSYSALPLLSRIGSYRIVQLLHS